MSFDLKNSWSVITGASSGIGSELAKELARNGSNLVLVARRKDRLDQLALACSEQFAIQTRVIALDLTAADAATKLCQQIADLPVQVLINNAGFGKTGPLCSEDWSAYQRMIQLNIAALTELTYRMLPMLKKHDRGARILNVGSIAGYQGVPNMAVYAATKAYVNHFSEGLHWELQSTQVKVTNLAPGKTESEFFDVSDMRSTQFAKKGVLSAEKVARQAVAAMVGGKRNLITGWDNKLNVFALRFSPRWLVGATLRYLFREMRE